MIMEEKCPYCGSKDYDVLDETYDDFYCYSEQRCRCKNGHEFDIIYKREVISIEVKKVDEE